LFETNIICNDIVPPANLILPIPPSI
jgi:hypothetical protein